MSSRKSSRSIRAESAVEPTRSENSTVTWRRSASSRGFDSGAAASWGVAEMVPVSSAIARNILRTKPLFNRRHGAVSAGLTTIHRSCASSCLDRKSCASLRVSSLNFAGNERRGSSNSRDSFNSRASVSALAIAVVRGRAVFDLLRRFPAAALPPALERRLIAFPKAQDKASRRFKLAHWKRPGAVLCVTANFDRECPLWVRSGHQDRSEQCLLY